MGLFTKSSQQEPQRASIPDFNSSDFSFQASKAIYTNIEHKIRYSPDGIFETNSPVIWQDDSDFTKSIRKTYVSPDTNYLIVFQGDQLFILTKQGHLLDTINNVDIAAPNQFDAASVQWDSDSSCFYLLYVKPIIFKVNKPDRNKSTLFCYRIDKKKLEVFVEFNSEVNFFHYHLSKDKQSIYFKPLLSRCFYKVSIKGDTGLFRIKTQSITGNRNSLYLYQMLCDGQPVVAIDKIEDRFDELFINFSKKDFEKGGVQVDSYDLKSILYCDPTGMYMSNHYKVSRVFSIVDDEERWYGKQAPDIDFYDAFFLPGNRFFVFKTYAHEYQGHLILDMVTNQYMKLPYKQVDAYFTVTSMDCPRMRFDFKVEPACDMSKFISRMETVNGKTIFVEVPLPQPNLRDILKEFKNE